MSIFFLDFAQTLAFTNLAVTKMFYGFDKFLMNLPRSSLDFPSGLW
jgi:hypothetical protein